jgi:hypothetical protein
MSCTSLLKQTPWPLALGISKRNSLFIYKPYTPSLRNWKYYATDMGHMCWSKIKWWTWLCLSLHICTHLVDLGKLIKLPRLVWLNDQMKILYVSYQSNVDISRNLNKENIQVLCSDCSLHKSDTVSRNYALCMNTSPYISDSSMQNKKNIKPHSD